ncbi:hypothetical protein KY084_10730 [Stakelama sp. CBK3Z-3]|uniref:Uncharacterized protein n=1 Tax=Stakelama flava TaxID=2860338 RepID=A0ABS6XMC9_9SPHN|nr:hypothetical protein [Stakelama flava]MBW4331347.1 hypothetical protein [Stakelama flava]
MLAEIKEAATRSLRFARWCPLLFALPVVVELIQHVIEVNNGFYDSLADMKAMQGAPARMAMGHVKVLMLMLAGFWVARFLAFDDDVRAARSINAKAAWLFVPVLAWGILNLVLVQDGPAIAVALGMEAEAASMLLLVFMVAGLIFSPCLSAWKVAAATGNDRIGFIRSIRLVRGSYLWALGFSLVVTLPLIAVHEGVALVVLGRGPIPTWLLLIADSLFVGFMAVIMVTTEYIIARRVTLRRDVPLLPEQVSGYGALPV